MCQNLVIEIRSVKELRKIMPKIVWADDDPCEDDDCCLCPVDLESTIKENGLDNFFKLDEDVFDHHIIENYPKEKKEKAEIVPVEKNGEES